jgi:hypothetical protein
MDIFELHGRIMGDYANYIRSFVSISDTEMRQRVETYLNDGHLWPEPLLTFNPSFAKAGRIEDLAASGVLAAPLRDALRGYELFEHQLNAIHLGTTGNDFVVTSGTGSGKSLTYIAAIFDHLFRAANPPPPGVTAVIVYPLNALVNSQEEELRRYAENYAQSRDEKFPIRFAKFTGQEDKARRDELEAEPPHILLTNYMMLELLLTRGGQRNLRQAIYDELRFLVFDELHTYRGRQGADVGMLIRRIRGRAKRPVVCIGTSATMISFGTLAEQKQQVAKVAEQLFGKPFKAEAVVQETLVAKFPGTPESDALKSAVTTSVKMDAGEACLLVHPTAAWLESRIALAEREGRLVRNKPLRFSEVIGLLAAETGQPESQCEKHLREVLLWIGATNKRLLDAGKRDTHLPFKLHQFFSQTGAIYVTLDRGGERHITLQTGYHVPGEPERPLFAAVFSRYSGETFLCVSRDASGRKLLSREFYPSEDEEDDLTRGYLIPNADLWNPETDLELLPDSWLDLNSAGQVRVQKKYQARMPQRLYYDKHGNCSDEPREGWMQGWLMSAPLLFDPTSGLMPDRQTKDSTKLSQLGTEGRSTATSISAFAILARMAEHRYRLRDQKLLSFMDNRQDAALQAGHFNDFMDVVRLRSAIRKAVESAEGKQLRLTTLGRAVRIASGLQFDDYATGGSDLPEFRKRIYGETLESYFALRAIHDLESAHAN